VVRWSDSAKADLRAIHDFIAHDSRHYAKKVTQDIVSRTDALAGLPRMTAAVSESYIALGLGRTCAHS
jgi:toxin ParE1/3/4